MTHDEAQGRARELNASDPDRGAYRWFAHRAASGDWDVVRVAAAAPPQGPLKPGQVGKVAQPEPAKQPLLLPGGLPPWISGG